MTALTRIDRAWAELDGGQRSASIRFCSRCGQPSGDGADGPGPFACPRVCRECGMGILLTCRREAIPGAGASFAIVTSDLRVSAVSDAGELILGEESRAVGTPLLDLVTSPLGDDSLARLVVQAAVRLREPAVLPVRSRAGAEGIGTMAARISTCGPPRAALVTVEPSEFGRR